MAAPVVTETWAGSFDCSGPCRRKRLMANEFSKRSMELYRRHGDDKTKPLRCIQCISAAATQERQSTAARPDTNNNHISGLKTTTAATTESADLIRLCAGPCGQNLPVSHYNKNQWNNKGGGLSRCKSCVEAAAALDLLQHQSQQNEQLYQARWRVEQEASLLSLSGNKSSLALVQAESALAALEAQTVTGLKPIRMKSIQGSRGGGRGRSARSRSNGGRGRGTARPG